MSRPSRSVRALVAVLCLSSASASLAQSPAPDPTSAAATNAAVALPAELADFFPAETTFYAEAHDIGASLERQSGAFDQVYAALPAMIPRTKDGEQQAVPFTADELRLMLHSDVAIGRAPGSRTGVGMLAVVRTSSPEAAAMLRDKALPLALGEAAKRHQTETVNGQPVTTVGEGSVAIAYAVTGETVVVGSAPDVRAVYAGTSKRDASLGAVPAFVSARRRISASADSFVWIGMKESEGAASDGIDGIALATTDGFVEGLVSLDRSKERLVTVLADAPAVDMRAAEFFPPDVQTVATFGFQPTRVFDYLMSPAAEEDGFVRGITRRPGEIEQEIGKSAGMSARDEFLASLGDHVTVAVDFGDMFTAEEGLRVVSVGSPSVLFAVEVTRPEVARRALIHIAAPSDAEPTDEPVDGVVVSRAGKMACAVVDNVALLGSSEDVDRALAAHKSGKTFAASQASAPLREQLAGNTVAALYVSPSVGKLMLASLVREIGRGFRFDASDALDVTPAPFVATLSKEDLGLYASTRSVSTAGSSITGFAAAVLVPSFMRSRAAANESSAIGTLRSIGNSEATFASREGRYASLQEIVEKKYADESLCEGCVRNGYRFRTNSASAKTFDVVAEPVPGELNGEKAYNITEDYVIRYAPAATPPKGKSGKKLGS